MLKIKDLFEQGFIHNTVRVNTKVNQIFSNLTLIISGQCDVNGVVTFEIQNIVVFLGEIKLVPTLIYLLLAVEYFHS